MIYKELAQTSKTLICRPHEPMTPSTPRQIQGSCLCKWIKFTITIPSDSDISSRYAAHFTSTGKLRATNCHCTTCRSSIGALFGTWAHVPADLLTITDLAMNTGTYRSSEHVTRKFCRVCGTSLFSPEDGWEKEGEDKEDMGSMYNREWRGKEGKMVDVSVGAMDGVDAKKWVEVVEHIYLEDMVDGGHWNPEQRLPMYCSRSRQGTDDRYMKGSDSVELTHSKDVKMSIKTDNQSL